MKHVYIGILFTCSLMIVIVGCSDSEDGTAYTLSVDDASIIENDSGTDTLRFKITLSADPGVDVTVDWITEDVTAQDENGDGDYVAASGTATITSGGEGSDVSIYITVNGDGDIESDETFRIVLSNPTIAGIADSIGIGTITNDDGVIYVDPTGDGTDGLTWQTAFTTIQNGITAAVAAGGFDVWVAAGTYSNAGDTESVLSMASSVNVYGGFEGYNTGSGVQETILTQRDWTTNLTVIDGESNAYHVVSAVGNATLSGFTIRNGHAAGSHPEDKGAGLYVDASYSYPSNDFIMSDCIIEQNMADSRGGGMFIGYGESAMITDCMFIDNSSTYEGGAIYINSADVVIMSSSFVDNSSDSSGGVILNGTDGSQTISDSVFRGNRARMGGNGGAISNTSDNLLINKCLFTDNSANMGGALILFYSEPSIINSVFTENRATMGGAISSHGDASGTTPTIDFSTFTGNSADYGSAIHASSNGTPDVDNTIIWGNHSRNAVSPIYAESGTMTFSYCDIETSGGSLSWSPSLLGEGGVATAVDGGSNIDDDPLFTNVPDKIEMTVSDGTTSTLMLLDASTSYVVGDVIEIENDGVIRTADSFTGIELTFSPSLTQVSTRSMVVHNWGVAATDLDIDVTLQTSSPCIDAGDPASVVTEDYEGTTRPQGLAADIGAYEKE